MSADGRSSRDPPWDQGVRRAFALEESSSLKAACPLGFSCLKSISPFEPVSDLREIIKT